MTFKPPHWTKVRISDYCVVCFCLDSKFCMETKPRDKTRALTIYVSCTYAFIWLSIIVNWVEWLWNPSDSFVICFCGPESAQRSKEFLFWLIPRSFAAPSLLSLSRLGFAGKHFSFVHPSPTPFPAPPPLVLFFCFSRWLQRSMYLRDSVQKRLLCRLEQKEWLMSLSFEEQVLFEIVGRNSRAQYRALNIFSA